MTDQIVIGAAILCTWLAQARAAFVIVYLGTRLAIRHERRASNG
jgi:hypothetical protein